MIDYSVEDYSIVDRCFMEDLATTNGIVRMYIHMWVTCPKAILRNINDK